MKLLKKHKSIWIASLVLCLFFSLVFGAFSHLSAKEPPRPYKATTVDECIQEKECFWHHLLLAVQTEPIKRQATQFINVKKWEKPVRYRRIGRSEDIKDEFVDSLLNDISTAFQQDISTNKKYNYLIVLTDDIEKELSGEFSGIFKRYFGKNLPLMLYKNIVKGDDRKCYYLNIQDPARGLVIDSYFAFLEKNNPDLKKCFKEAIYAGFGLADISYSPIVQSHGNPDTYSKLELVLILFVYQDFIKSGMSYEQLKKVFDIAYTPFIESLHKQGVFDGN